MDPHTHTHMPVCTRDFVWQGEGKRFCGGGATKRQQKKEREGGPDPPIASWAWFKLQY